MKKGHVVGQVGQSAVSYSPFADLFREASLKSGLAVVEVPPRVTPPKKAATPKAAKKPTEKAVIKEVTAEEVKAAWLASGIPMTAKKPAAKKVASKRGSGNVIPPAPTAIVDVDGNVAPVQADAKKPQRGQTERNTRPAGKAKPFVFSTHNVAVPAGREYAIIFEADEKHIQSFGDIQIGSSSGGGKAVPKEAELPCERTHLEAVRVDMVSFDQYFRISGINILTIPGSSLCRVFVNLKSSTDDKGEHWGKGTDYERFLSRVLFGRKWNKVGIKVEAGKTSINLKKPDPDPKAAAELLLSFCS